MIDKPETGMRVTVDNHRHCCESMHGENHGGPGTITYIVNANCFKVLMDDSPGEWFRCRECVSELDKGATNEQ